MSDSQVIRVLRLLREAGDKGVANYDVAKICIRWHARIGDLRADGYGITCARQSYSGKLSNVWNYYLVSEPEN